MVEAPVVHPSSLENMGRAKAYLNIGEGAKVLDVGGRGLSSDRSYRSLFENTEYFVADIEDGLGVTHVMPGPYELPFDDGFFDLVVSGQMLEHCANPFKSVAEMRRVLKPGCRMVLIAPSSGPRHDKQDGWRFMDDAFRFIADEVGLKVIADWIDRGASDERSRKWQDHIFIGERS